MVLWSLIAGLTAAASFAVLWPLSRERESERGARAAARVYRDQLNEIERDRGRGLLAPDEAEAARAEIARRLLAEEESGRASAPPGGKARGSALRRRRAGAIVALVGVPAMTLGLYAALGSPHLPSQPLAARFADQDVADADVDTLVARVEQRLAAVPSDLRGWELIAPVYLRLGRAEDAARAFRAAIRLDGETAPRMAGLGEALTLSSGGMVTDEAATAFARALERDPDEPRALYYAALAKAQDGDARAAIEDWRALLDGAEEDTPWRDMVRQRIAAARAGLDGGDGEGVR